MQISERIICTLPSGVPVRGFRLENRRGSSVEVSDFGARWLAAFVPDRNGKRENVLLSPDDLTSDTFYMGATVGRVANRIARARVVICGIEFLLDRNDGANSNHGGHAAFDKQIWSSALLDDGVRFSRISPDGENGFPGNLSVEVDYRWNDADELTVEFRAVTDAPTVVNLTNHAYFNLNPNAETAYHHLLRIPSRLMLDTAPDFIPTGIIRDISGTPFDFTEEKRVGRDIGADDRQLVWNRGYNHCYVLKTAGGDDMTEAACLRDCATGRTLHVVTDQNSVLLYSAGFYSRPGAAVCLETQNWPDAPSHSGFPSILLRPGEVYRRTTLYKFGLFDA